MKILLPKKLSLYAKFFKIIAFYEKELPKYGENKMHDVHKFDSACYYQSNLVLLHILKALVALFNFTL